MKNLFFLLFLMANSLALSAQDSKKEAISVAEQFFVSIKEGKVGELKKNVTYDFQIMNFDGTLADIGLLSEGIHGGYITLDKAELKNSYARLYKDTVIITGNWDVAGQVANSSVKNLLAYTAVCVKEGAVWKIASVHLSPTM